MHTARELKYGLRRIRHTPASSTTAILVLALGIGAATAIFQLINVVILRPLPIREPEQLVTINWHMEPPVVKDIRSDWNGYEESATFSYPAFELLQTHVKSLSSVFGFAPLQVGPEGIVVRLSDHSSIAHGEAVAGSYFEGLDIKPFAGRFIARVVSPGDAKVIVISHAFLLREFGSDPSAIGKAVFLGSTNLPFTIIGVTPPEFQGVEPGHPPDFWIPASQWPSFQIRISNSRSWWVTILGRRNPQIDIKQATAELSVLFQQSLPAEILQKNAGNLPSIDIASCSTGLGILQKTLSKPLWLLFYIVGLVLLIACVNVAVLMLAKSSFRRRETAVRLSLGMPRTQIAGQVFIETFLLCSAGGLFGLCFAYWGAHALTTLFSGIVAQSGFQVPSRGIDVESAFFCGGLSMLAAILAGTIPAWRMDRSYKAAILKGLESDSPPSGRPRWLKLREVLIVVQIAVSLEAVAASGLLLRTLEKLMHQDLGFVPQKILLFSLNAREQGYQRANLTDFYIRFLQRLRTLPEVASATASTLTMISPLDSSVSVTVEGHQNDPSIPRQANLNLVGPDFFQVMGTRILGGRGIDWNDMNNVRRIAVINDSLRRHFFDNQEVVGKHFGFGNDSSTFEIIGIVEDAKYHSVTEEPSPRIYVPFTRLPGIVTAMPQGMFFEVRANRGLPELILAIRKLAHEFGPDFIVKDVASQEEQVNASFSRQRVLSKLASLLSIFVLLLVALGLYGILSYAVARQTREIGIRLALGEARKYILWSVLRRALVLVGIGVLVGLPTTMVLSRMVVSQLYGVGPNDLLTMIITTLIFMIVALLAGYVPARAATRVDPITILHYE